MKMRYILGLLLLPVVAIAQTTTPLVNKTTGAFVSPPSATIVAGNGLILSSTVNGYFADPSTNASFSSSAWKTDLGYPTSTTDNTIPRFDGTTGALQTSSATISDAGTISASIMSASNVYSTTSSGAVNNPTYGWAAVNGTGLGLYRVGSNESGATANDAQKWGWDATGFYFGATAGKLRWSHTDANVDAPIFWDDSASAYVGLTLSGLTITATTLTVDAATESAAGKAELSTQAEAEAGTNDTTAMTPLKVNQRIANTARLIYNDTKTSGTAGGTFTSGAWQTRTLNTEVIDTESIGTLSGNEITLPVGTYIIRWSCPAFAVGLNQSRLYGVSDIAASAYGTNSRSGNSDSTMSISSGVAIVTITLGSKTYRIEHQCETTVATTGFGNSMGFGSDEIYTTVDIQKID